MTQLRLIACGSDRSGKTTLIEQLSNRFTIASMPADAADIPGRVTEIASADVAIILLDASQGLSPQTRRDWFITSLFGVRHAVIAVNEMDQTDFDEAIFQSIVEPCQAFADKLDFESVAAIPLSASPPWYQGPTLLEYLQTISADCSQHDHPFRFPVQQVVHTASDDQNYVGTVVAGSIGTGQPIRVLPSGEFARVTQISQQQFSINKAITQQAVAIRLDRALDISPGDLLVEADQPCEVSDQFAVSMVWSGQGTGFIGRSYDMEIGTRQVKATITAIKHKYNTDTLTPLSGHTLNSNDIGEITISLDKPVPFEALKSCKSLGVFTLRDSHHHAGIAVGIIRFMLRRAQNIHRQALAIDKKARARLNGHAGKVLWFTGLSGSGKSTIANALEQVLHQRSMRTYILDGDNVRQGLNKDLGFTDADRIENIRRIAEVAKLMVDAGIIVLTAFISPFRSERETARSLFETQEFVEIHVDVDLEIAERRDPKGLYRKARRGELPNFTGIDSDYQAPETPEVCVDSGKLSVDDCVRKILQKISL